MPEVSGSKRGKGMAESIRGIRERPGKVRGIAAGFPESGVENGTEDTSGNEQNQSDNGIQHMKILRVTVYAGFLHSRQ
jgi:hypothetical protein